MSDPAVGTSPVTDTDRALTDTLHFEFEVDCPPTRAFHLWTSRISTWWPADHSVSGDPGIEVVFEGRVGGGIFERTSAGDVHEWGAVTQWDPPGRLAYTWHLRADRADATTVEVRFVPVPEERTRVEIDHRDWERLGAGAAPRRQANRRGWETLLPHFLTAVQQQDRAEGDR